MILNRKKAKRDLERLRKYILKIYDKNDQFLYLTSLECWEQEPCMLDIVDTNKEGNYIGKYLFSVSNLKTFESFDARFSFYMKDTGFYSYFDSDLVSITPFYFDRTFTLKSFKPITEEDIENCAKYFIRKILDSSKYLALIWNIKFIKPRE